MSEAKAYAAQQADQPLGPFKLDRREPGADDVEIKILYSGVCHSDIHTARNEWGGTMYPVVPGHEIVGKVTRVGSAVSKFKVGDTVGVGCFVIHVAIATIAKTTKNNTAKMDIPKPIILTRKIKKPLLMAATRAIS